MIVGIRESLGKWFRVPAPTHLEQPISVQSALEKPNAPNHEYKKQSPVVIEIYKSADIPAELELNIKKARMSQIYRRGHW